MQSLTIVQVVSKGLWYQRWMQLPISLGVAAATAVIVGALVVGDSVRTSLRDLALDRLGKVDYVLIAPRFFDESILANWQPTSNQFAATREGIILFPRSTVEKKSIANLALVESTTAASTSIRIAGGTMCMGIEESFWSLGDLAPQPKIADDEAIINMALAEELDVTVGSRISVRLPALQAVPADSPLGKRDESTVSLPNLRVIAILPNRSLARFDLRSNQRPARNVFVAKSAIQAILERPGQINASLVSTQRQESTNSGSLGIRVSASENANEMLSSLPVTLDDLGYSIKPILRKFPDPTIGETQTETGSVSIVDYLQIASDQLLVPPDALDAIEAAFPAFDPTTNAPVRSSLLAYLANAITKVPSDSTSSPEPEIISSPAISSPVISYSTIVGIEPASLDAPSVGFGQAATDDELRQWVEKLSTGEVLINSWLAEQSQASAGDSLRIDYYVPETIDGLEVETSVVMKVAGVVPITEPDSGYRRNRSAKFSTPPTPFNDPEMVPKVPGITDQESMSDWDLPFALTRKIRTEDDEYWNNYRLTPKLYMSLKEAQRLFGSRFGNVSSIRIADKTQPSSTDMATPSAAEDELGKLKATLLSSLRTKIKELGWQVLPLRAQQIAASKGTTPFDALFLALSMFVIVSALLLVSLLFRLSIERRMTEWGLLKSIGFSPSRIQSVLRIEGLSLSFVGAVIGVVLGIAYGYFVIELLKSWWVGAVGTPFLDFHVQLSSLVIGSLIGISMAWLTIVVSARFIDRQSPIKMLKGIVAFRSAKVTLIRGAKGDYGTDIHRKPLAYQRLTYWSSRIFWLIPIAVVIIGLGQTGPAAAGAFVGAGMLMLFGMVIASYRLIRKPPSIDHLKSQRMTLISLAANSVRRNPWRSVLAIGLMAIASFLILSISLFEASPDSAGTGGFDLMVQSTVAVPKNLSDKTYQRETLGDRAASLDDTTIIPIRVRDGDDAGCSNLYQAAQPQVYGISPKMRIWNEQAMNQTEHSDFAWAAKGAIAKGISPWRQLESPSEGTIDSPVPVILDQNTALWALHLTGTTGEEFHYEMGNQTVYFKTVAVLQNTILQGSLIIGESNFQILFPEISGYRTWLVRDDSISKASKPSERDAIVEKISRTLESGWSDEGMDAATTSSILRNLLAVQNTYLKAFQSLGGLGLLLGTFGLAVVQMRSIQERRSELGLMKAIGFSESRLGKFLLLESVTLLGWGIGIGLIAAFMAILPTLIQGTIPVGVFSPAITMLVILLFGLVSALVAVRSGVRVPMLKALRSE